MDWQFLAVKFFATASMSLEEACRSGHFSRAVELLPSQETESKHVLTDALHYAARYGELEFMKLLIQTYKCKTTFASKVLNDMPSVIHTASHYGHLNIVEYLTTHNLEGCPFTRNSAGRTPLHLASAAGNYKVVKYLDDYYTFSFREFKTRSRAVDTCEFCAHSSKSEKETLFECRDVHGQTPLHCASENGHLNVVEYLLKLCDPNAVNNDKRTALHLAVKNRWEHVAEALAADERCNLGLVDNNKKSALHMTSNTKFLRVILLPFKFDHSLKLMRSRTKIDQEGNTVLHFVCNRRDYELVKFFLPVSQPCLNDYVNVHGETPLHSACIARNKSRTKESLKILEELLKAKFSAFTEDNRKINAQYIACMNQDYDALKVLGRAGLGIDPSDKCFKRKDGYIPLHDACARGDHELALLLLTVSDEKQLNEQSSKGETPLYKACERKSDIKGKVLTINALLKNSHCIPTIANTEKRYTPLHIACIMRDVDVVKLLVSHDKCNRNDADIKGRTPLHFACARSKEIVKLLLEKGFSATIKDKNGMTPFDEACNKFGFDDELLSLLVSHDKGALFDACKMTKKTAQVYVKILIESNHEFLNYKNENGCTPLHIVCGDGNSKMVSMLLAYNQAQINRKDNDGNTPLHHALGCTGNCIATTRVLLSHSTCDVTTVNKKSQLPLEIACLNKGVLSDVTLLLLKNSKVVNGLLMSTSTVLICGCSILHFACIKKDLSLLVSALHRHKPLINDRDGEGRTPLHYACIIRETDLKQVAIKIARTLLACDNCDPSIQDLQGKVPLQRLFENHCSNELVGFDHKMKNRCGNELMRMLLITCSNYEPDPCMRNRQGYTLLIHSCYTLDHELCSIILRKVCRREIINLTDTEGNTALHHIVCGAIKSDPGGRSVHVSIIKTLLECEECDPSLKNMNGKTPLQLVFENSTYRIRHKMRNNYTNELMKIILSCSRYDPDLTIKNGQGTTLLMHSCHTQDLELCSIVLRKECLRGKIINLKDEDGNTALHHIVCGAVKSDPGGRSVHVSIIETLLECEECDPSLKNMNWKTPLQLVFENSTYRIRHKMRNNYTNKLMKIILSCSRYDPDLNIKNRQGTTLLMHSCHTQDLELCSIVLRKECLRGTIINLKDEDGKTALHHICSCKPSWTTRQITKDILKVTACTFTQDRYQCTPLYYAYEACKQYRDDSIVKLLIQCDIKGKDTLLHEFCMQDNLKMVKLLLSRYSDNVNVKNSDGNTPLHLARSSAVMIAMTEKAECDFDIKNNNGRTPLHLAYMRGDIAVVKFLLSKNCDINLPDNSGKVPLHHYYAYEACKQYRDDSIVKLSIQCDIKGKGTLLHEFCMQDNLEMVKLLLSRYSDNVNVKNSDGNTPLHLARSSAVMIAMNEKAECDFNIKNNNGRTPLHLACMRGDIAVVKFLLSKNCDINLPDNSGKVPLHHACRYNGLIGGKRKMLKALLADPRCIWDDRENYTPLHMLCEEGDHEMVKMVLSSKLCLINTRDTTGNNSIHYALRSKSSKCSAIVKLLLENGCEPSAAGYEDQTPLHIACQRKDAEIAIMLISNPTCDVNAEDVWGKTPLIYVLGKTPLFDTTSETYTTEIMYTTGLVGRRTAILKALLCNQRFNPNKTDTRGQKPLQRMLCYHDTETFKLFLSNVNFTLDYCDSDGNTVLHVFIKEKYYDWMKIALSNNRVMKCININHQNKNCQSILHIACTDVHSKDVLSVILSTGKCDLTLEDNNGCTPLHLACFEDTSEKVALLLSHCTCDVNAQNFYGDTPLHYACRWSNEPKIVKLLIKTGKCDVNIQNSHGQTALHFATEMSVIDMLSSASNCKLNITDVRGCSPLNKACSCGQNTAVVALLAKQQCDVNSQDNDGKTPLHHAVTKLPNETVEQLATHKDLDPRKKDSDGNGILHTVCKDLTRDEIFGLILSTRKCDVNMKNNERQTPLHLLLISHENRKGNSKKEDKHFAKQVCLLLDCYPKIQQKKDGQTPLHVACRLNYKEAVKVLISNSTYINMRDSTGQTPLHIACDKEYPFEIFELLTTSEECDPNIPDVDGRLPLEICYCNKQCNKFAAILKTKKASLKAIRHVFDKEWPPLHILCVAGEYDVVLHLLYNEELDWNEKDTNGETPLHCTLSCNPYSKGSLEKRTSVAKLLLIYPKCDSRVTDSGGNTILHIACKLAHHELITAIKDIDHEMCRSVVNERNKRGHSPLHLACFWEECLHKECSTCSKPSYMWLRSQKQAVEVLLTDLATADDTSILNLLHQNGKIDLLKVLLLSGNKYPWPDIAITDSNGRTPLHTSAAEGDLELVEALLSDRFNLNINRQDKYGNTALHCAFRRNITTDKNRIEIMKLLVEHKKFNPFLVDQSNHSPLEKSFMDRNIKAFKFLLFREIFPNKKMLLMFPQKDGDYTPLHLACECGDAELVMYLLKTVSVGKVINSQDSGGKTPLYYACEILEGKGRREVIKLLMEKKNNCNPNIRSRMKPCKTALHILNDKEDHETLQILVENENCNPNLILHEACLKGNVEIVKVLLSNSKCDPLRKRGRKTPVECTQNPNILRELFKHGANPDSLYHRNVLSVRTIPTTPVKMFILGDAEVGKTTLVNSLQKESSFFVRLFTQQASASEERTPGVVPHNFESKLYGKVTMFDFAGQREFYGTHDAFLSNTIGSCPPMFLLVVDLRKDLTDIKQNLEYWKIFLVNHSCSLLTEPHMTVVGSHLDVVMQQKSESSNPELLMSDIDSVMKAPRNKWYYYVGSVAMNCKEAKSTEINSLRELMKQSCDELRSKVVIDFNCHCFLVYLIHNFSQDHYVTMAEIHDKINNMLNEMAATTAKSPEHLGFIPREMDRQIQICEKLSDQGHLLFLKDRNTPKNSLVVTDTEFLFSKVTGTLFAPNIKGFKHQSSLACSTGVISYDKLHNALEKLKRDEASLSNFTMDCMTKFFSHLECCNEVNDPVALELITKYSTASRSEIDMTQRYYFFPSLVTADYPRECESEKECKGNCKCEKLIWEKSTNSKDLFIIKFGWILKCENGFLTPRFLHVLILRLAFAFALVVDSEYDFPALQRKCSIWKSGIFWGSTAGIDHLVSMTPDQDAVFLLIRSKKSSYSYFLTDRSNLIQMITTTAREICPGIKTEEYIILADEILRYPRKPIMPSQKTSVSLQHLYDAIPNSKENQDVVLNCGKSVDILEDLLVYEPYICLYDTSNSIDDIRAKLGKNGVREDDLTWLKEHPSEENLKDGAEKLKKYSVFCSGKIHLVDVENLPVFVAGTCPGLSKPLIDQKPTLKNLDVMYTQGNPLRVIEEVAPVWESVFIQLDLETRVKSVRKEYRNDGTSACRKMFNEWLERKGVVANWRTLIEAMKAVEDLTVFAEELKRHLS